MTRLSRLFHVAIVLALFSLLAQSCLAHGAERGQAKATVGGAHVSIDYGRPSLNGRDPLKMLKPGTVWRLGADASTTLDSDKDLAFGNTKVPKGNHILLAHLADGGKWTLVVSQKPYNQYDPSAKIAEIPLMLQEASDPVEDVTIKLSANDGTGVIEIAWGKMRLSGSFKAAE